MKHCPAGIGGRFNRVLWSLTLRLSEIVCDNNTLLIRPCWVKYALKQEFKILHWPATVNGPGVLPPGIIWLTRAQLPAGIKTDIFPGNVLPITIGVINRPLSCITLKPFLLPQNPCVKPQKVVGLQITVIDWLTVPLWFPQASTATQLLVSVNPVPAPATVTSPTWFTVAPLQTSDAVGGVNDGVAGHVKVAFAPGLPIVGGVLSVTVITCVLVAEWLPQASVASHVLVNTLRQDVPVVVFVSKFTVAPLQLSAAVGTVKFGVAVQSMVAFCPALPIVGGVLSMAVITCVLVAE
jgi:hypothetical protein